MDHILKKYCPRIEFDSYEDFFANLRIETPHDFNFAYDVVDEWARVEPDKRALLWCDDHGHEKVFTFGEIADLSNRAAQSFQKLGITKGDVVLLVLRRRWEYWIAAVALWKLGAIVIPGTIQLTTKDIAYRLSSAEAKMIICVDDDYVIEQAEGAFPLTPSIQHKVIVASEQGREGWTRFEDLIAEPACDFKRPEGELATTSDDPFMIYFTSGTTGNAKMVRHSHRHPLGHIITARYWQQVQENKLHLSVTDSGWAKFGWGKIFGQWICGATVFAYDMERFIPTKLLEMIQNHQITTFCAPPTMYRFMLQEDVASFDLSSVQNFTTAGEPLNAEVSNKWFNVTGKRIREGFGQSESVVLIGTFPWIEPRPGSLGKPSPLQNIKLLNNEGLECEDGEEGAICVTNLKSAYPPGLFVGYHNDPQRTQETVGGDVYNLHDMAWRDSDGYYSFVGRDDDVIKCSGYRIGPFEVESALIAHPAVVECAITGAPDPIRGLVVKATVVLAKGYEPSDELTKELQNHVKHTTAPYKYPRIVEYVDELPKTIGGKIKRKLIRDTDAGK